MGRPPEGEAGNPRTVVRSSNVPSARSSNGWAGVPFLKRGKSFREFQGIIRRKALADPDGWIGRAEESLVTAFVRRALNILGVKTMVAAVRA